MNGFDVIYILFIIFGIVRGWRSGAVTKLVSLVGTILILVLAFFLKTPISILLYTKLPFYRLGGIFAGVSSINIIIYEFIAYILCLIILGTILALVLKLTGIVDKLLKFTIILALPDQIIGAAVGALQYFLIGFAFSFICSIVPALNESLTDSTFTSAVLEHTPIVSNITHDLYDSINDIYQVCVKHKDENNKSVADYEATEILLQKKIISAKSLKTLRDADKINFDNINELIKKYQEE